MLVWILSLLFRSVGVRKPSKGRLAVRVALVLAVLLELVGSTARSAGAFVPTTYTYPQAMTVINDPANATALQDLLLKYPSSESGLPSTLALDESSGIAAAESAAGIGSTLTAAGLVVGAGAASYMVTRELLHLTGGDSFFYRAFGGSTSIANATVTSVQWVFKSAYDTVCPQPYTTTACAGTAQIGVPQTLGTTGAGGLILRANAGSSPNVDIPNSATSTINYGLAFGTRWATAATPSTSSAFTIGAGMPPIEALQAGVDAGALTSQPASVGDYANAPNPVDLGSRPATLTSAQLAAARTALGNGAPTSQAAAKAIAETLVPSPATTPAPTPVVSATPITLPRPALNESAQEWMDRLRALGWTGAATVLVYDGDPLLGGAER
jgi:hypothetical protein